LIPEFVQRYIGQFDSGFCESALFGIAWECDCINLGPGPSKMCHSKGEYVNIDEIIKTTKLFVDIIYTQ